MPVGTALLRINKNILKGYMKDSLGATDDMIQSASEYMDIHNATDLFPNKRFMEDLKIDDVKNALRIGYSKRRESELQDSLSSVLDDAKKQGLNENRNLFEFFNARIKTNSAALEESHKAFVGSLESEVVKSGGKQAYSIYKLAFSNPKKLKKLFNISNEDVFIALADPSQASSDVLRVIGKVYRKLDNDFVKKIQDLALLGEVDDYVVPLTPNPNVIESLGKEGLVGALTKYTLISLEGATKIANDYFKAATKYGPQRGKISFPKRQLQFADGREGLVNQFHFYKTITGLDDSNSGVLERLIYHKEKVLQKAYFFKEFGMHPEETINKIYQKMKKGADAEKLKDMVEGQKKNLHTLDAAMGRLQADYGSVRFFADAANKFISAVYGAPQSLIRNMTIDNVMHALSIYKSFLNNQGMGGFLSQKFVNPMQLVLARGLQPKLRRGLNDILNVMDFAQTNNALFATQGLRRENFFGNILDLEGSKTYTEKIGRVLNDWAGKLNYATQGLAGNVTHYDATTAVNILNSATAFSELILKSVGYDDFMRHVGPLGEKYLKWHFGLGENEFRALKEAYQSVSDIVPVNSAKKILGFQDVRIILPSMLDKMDDSIANKYRVKGETAEAFKNRVRIAYHSFLTHQRNLAQTGLYRGNRIIEQSLRRGSFMDLILRPFAPFFNITHAQHYDGLRAGLSLSMYGTPYNTAYADTMNSKAGLLYWTKAFSFYTTGAFATMALKDTLSGREVRAMTPKQAGLLIASSGVGGIPFSLFSQSFYSGTKGVSTFFGDTPTGSYLSDFAALFANLGEGKDLYRTAKFIQNTTGVGKLWWSKGMVDKLMRNTLLKEEDRVALEKWYAEELKSPFHNYKGD